MTHGSCHSRVEIFERCSGETEQQHAGNLDSCQQSWQSKVPPKATPPLRNKALIKPY